MAESRRGLILINTGPGKGKTTAALGTGVASPLAMGCGCWCWQFPEGLCWHDRLVSRKCGGQRLEGKFVLKQIGPGLL